jgi:transcriptional regulator with XRE-family HTH domain
LEYSDKPFDKTLDDLFSSNQVGLREFARKSGVNYSYLSKLKNGKMPPPSNDVMQKIARGFRISTDYFLEYRLRHVYELLVRDPDLVVALHLLCKQPPPRQKKIKTQFMNFVEKEVSNN